MKDRKLFEDKRNQALKLFLDGVGYAKIAKTVGVCYATVHNWRRDFDWGRLRDEYYQKIEKERMEFAIEEAKKGLADISEIISIHYKNEKKKALLNAIAIDLALEDGIQLHNMPKVNRKESEVAKFYKEFGKVTTGQDKLQLPLDQDLVAEIIFRGQSLEVKKTITEGDFYERVKKDGK